MDKVVTSISTDVVIFAAHPDDAESCVGGTIIDYLKKGKKVQIVNMTTDPATSEQAREGKRAAAMLGVNVDFLSLATGEHDLWFNSKNFSIVQNYLMKKKPEIVFTHWPFDFYLDHQSTGDLVLRAILNLKGKLEPKLYFYEACTGYQTHHFHPNKYVDITNYVARKKKVIACYKSQKPFAKESGPWYSVHEKMMAFRGLEAGVPYAEAFVEMPEIGLWLSSLTEGHSIHIK